MSRITRSASSGARFVCSPVAGLRTRTSECCPPRQWMKVGVRDKQHRDHNRGPESEQRPVIYDRTRAAVAHLTLPRRSLRRWHYNRKRWRVWCLLLVLDVEAFNLRPQDGAPPLVAGDVVRDAVIGDGVMPDDFTAPGAPAEAGSRHERFLAHVSETVKCIETDTPVSRTAGLPRG